jgi:exodeoxyribonuclease V alpha subunit
MTNLEKESLQELSGVIEKVIYKSDSTSFFVLTIKVSSKESVTATGIIHEVYEGEILLAQGVWKFHPKFGRQFEIKKLVSTLPSSVLGIQKYLSSGMIKGIGPKFAEKIVKKFGEKTLEVIDKKPTQLLAIPGVGHGRVAMITTAWKDQREISKVMVFLQEKEISPAYATKIFKTYGNAAIEKIQQNPYQLVEDIWGIGFKSADKIALNIGLKRDSVERIKAGVLYLLFEATNVGNLYEEKTVIKEKIYPLLDIDKELCKPLVNGAFDNLYQEKKIKILYYKEKQYLTVPSFYFSEMGIAKKIKKFITNERFSHNIDLDAVYKKIRLPHGDFVLNEQQQEGVMSCLQNRITVITGGPGTGKTTLLKTLIGILDEYRLTFRLAAPTGRAAKRMFESTKKNTETLHRLLEFNPSIMAFNKNEENVIPVHFLIIDEASMIDVFLMHSVLKALPYYAQLILLGDIDQLPSVGAGNVLRDIIASRMVNVVRLRHIFRQAQNSLIIINAHKVNSGEFPIANIYDSKRDFYYLKKDEPESFYPVLYSLYKQKLARKGITADHAMVLSPMNRGTCGVYRINEEIQRILNPVQPEEKKVMRFGQEYKVKDRVMQIKNNYDKFVFNGDIGYIQDIEKHNHTLAVRYNERVVPYDFSELNELVLAYSISIHKSQGSEFDAVIIPIFMQHFILLQRNLLYTAITRAKKLCILIGQSKAIALAIKNNKSLKRLTFLKQFLTTDLQAE